MTTIAAKTIADSVGIDAPRLTTIQLRYPRFIHAELMTHRVFSRNARSSRAVPIAKMIAEAETDYAEPLHWGKAQPGMYAREELTGVELELAKQSWHRARLASIHEAKIMLGIGLAKQNVNRILEPYIHIDVLVTATEWENWNALRDHGDAEPHIMRLAQAIRAAMNESEPRKLNEGQWHLPYIVEEDWSGDFSGYSFDEITTELRKISAARCARISYMPFDENRDLQAKSDVALASRLAKSGHWSPFEHQACPDETTFFDDKKWKNAHQHRNLRGWRQHRAMIDVKEAA